MYLDYVLHLSRASDNTLKIHWSLDRMVLYSMSTKWCEVMYSQYIKGQVSIHSHSLHITPYPIRITSLRAIVNNPLVSQLRYSATNNQRSQAESVKSARLAPRWRTTWEYEYQMPLSFSFCRMIWKREKRRKEKTTKTVVGTYYDHVSLPLRAPSIWWQIANVGNVISWAEFIRDLRASNPDGSGDNHKSHMNWMNEQQIWESFGGNESTWVRATRHALIYLVEIKMLIPILV